MLRFSINFFIKLASCCSPVTVVRVSDFVEGFQSSRFFSQAERQYSSDPRARGAPNLLHLPEKGGHRKLNLLLRLRDKKPGMWPRVLDFFTHEPPSI